MNEAQRTKLQAIADQLSDQIETLNRIMNELKPDNWERGAVTSVLRFAEEAEDYIQELLNPE